MAEVYFPDSILNFIRSLGSLEVDVFADLHLIQRYGPERFEFCEDHGNDLWEYRRAIGGSRYAYLLFDAIRGSSSYIVLHGFRGGPEGPSSADLREARRRRKAN